MLRCLECGCVSTGSARGWLSFIAFGPDEGEQPTVVYAPRALGRGNVTEALSAAGELQFVGLAEALERTLLLADGEDARYERAALRWHARFV